MILSGLNRNLYRKLQNGFTVPEVMITLVVSAMFVTLILQFGINYWRYGLFLSSDTDTLVTRLNVQDFLRENIGSSSGLINQNSISDTAALNPDASIAGGHFWTPLHAIPGTINATGTGTTPLIYYKKFSINSSNNFIMNGTQPYEDEYVAYIDNSSKKLLVRTLANASAPGNKAVSSCAPASATPSCPSDKVIATDLASITTRFFSRSGNTIDWTSAFDSTTGVYVGPDYTSVEVAEFTVKLAQRPGFEKTDKTKNTTVVRIALRNT